MATIMSLRKPRESLCVCVRRVCVNVCTYTYGHHNELVCAYLCVSVCVCVCGVCVCGVCACVCMCVCV